MMKIIKDVDRLLMRLAVCVRFDHTNPMVLHVEIDNLISLLSEWNMYVPNTAYTELVNKMLNEQIVDKIPVDVNQPYVRRQLAKAFLQLASNVIHYNEHTAEDAHQERIKFFGEEGTLHPTKGKVIM